MDSVTPRRKRIAGSFGFFASESSMSLRACVLWPLLIRRWISRASADGAAACAGTEAGATCATAAVVRPEAIASAATARESECSDVIEERETRMVAVLGVFKRDGKTHE